MTLEKMTVDSDFRKITVIIMTLEIITLHVMI